LFAVKVNDIWGSVNIIRKRFKKVALARFISGIIGPIVIFIGIKELGIFALVMYSGVASLMSFVYYKRFGRIKYDVKFDKETLKNLFKDGVILQLLAISFWAFRLSDRTMISVFLSSETLGIYTFAASLALILKNFIGEFHTVLQPVVWGTINTNDKSSFESLLTTVYFISVVSFIFIPISQLVFYIIVNYYSPEYASASAVFNILSFATYFIAVGGIVGIILNSGEIKKYKISLYYSITGLLLNIMFDYLLIMAGYGILAIALVTLIVQSLIGMIQFIHIRTYLFNSLKDLLIFYIVILLPFSVLMILFYYLNQSFIITSLSNGIINVLIPILMSGAGLFIYKKTYYET
jgi:O-antigen/teichoic acid export membrane protein